MIGVTASDPEDARRRRLLNILLLAMATGLSLLLVVALLAVPAGIAGEGAEIRGLHVAMGLGLLGVAVVYALNRYVSVKLASVAFLLLWLAIAVFGDEPRQVVGGRGVFTFAFPILMASILLPPWTSFVMAVLSSLAVGIIGKAIVGQTIPNVPAMISFLALALAAHLSAQSLARALKRLRTANGALRESEERYRDLFENVPIALWEEDFSATKAYLDDLRDRGVEDFRRHFERHPEDVARCAGGAKIVDVNRATLALYGAENKEAILAGPERMLNEEAHDIFMEELIALAEGRTQFHAESVSRTLMGEQLDIDLRLSVARGYENTLSKVLLSATDITGRKRAEERSRHFLDRQIAINGLTLALGDASDLDQIYPIVYEHVCELMDAEAFIVSFYERGPQLIHAGYGVCSGSVRDVTSSPPIPLEEEGHGTQSWVIRTGEPLYIPDYRKAMPRTQSEYTIEKDDALVEDSPIPDEKEEPTSSTLYVPMEVQGKTIGVMQVQSHRLDAYTQEDVDLLSGLASVAAIAIQNSRLFDILERSNEELLRHRETLEQLMAARSAEVDVRVAEVGQLNRALSNLLEDQQVTNRNLERMAQELQGANEELESFAYSISHDLRAPLRAMDGFSRILMEEHAPDLSPEAQRYLGMVRDNARQMGELIADLLAFSRLGRKPLDKQAVDPAAIVRQVLEELRDEQEGRWVEIAVGDLPPCQADPALLKQVFVNLLTNALKYTRERDPARIEIGYSLPPSGEGRGDGGTYFIKDNGVGFDMRYVDKLFGVFQRFHRAEDYEGTGVGLAIVHRIVSRHGGRVWGEAKVNEGATFCFTI